MAEQAAEHVDNIVSACAHAAGMAANSVGSCRRGERLCHGHNTNQVVSVGHMVSWVCCRDHDPARLQSPVVV